MLLKKKEIQNLERRYRLNLINSISGIKPANLVGSRSLNEIDNLAIFSSVVHLGSNPALLGMVMRPQTSTTKDTYSNIMDTGFFTINHVSQSFIKKAHYTSAKLEMDQSEFDIMNIEKEFIEDFYAPFVKASAVKIGLKYVESHSLSNECIFITGEVLLAEFPDKSCNEKGQLDLSSYDCVGISGLNTYYSLSKIESFPYVRVSEIPDFNK